MVTELKIQAIVLVAALGAIFLFGGLRSSYAQLPILTGIDEEVSPDGLHRVDIAVMDSAWVIPDFDLSAYTSLYFMPSVITFRQDAIQRADAYSASSNAVFFISDAEQNSLSRLFGAAFYEELPSVEYYELTTEVGRNVLMIRALLLDVISGVEPIAPGSESNVVDTIWEGALVLELRDSFSNDTLARTSEIVRAEGPVDIDEIWIRTEQEVERWSKILYSRLEELRELSHH